MEALDDSGKCLLVTKTGTTLHQVESCSRILQYTEILFTSFPGRVDVSLAVTPTQLSASSV